MKKRLLFALLVISFIFIIGCVSKENVEIEKTDESIRDYDKNIQEPLPTTAQVNSFTENAKIYER